MHVRDNHNRFAALRALLEFSCPSSSERMKSVVNRDRLAGGCLHPPCGVCVRVYTMAGYAHLTDAHLIEAAEKVGNAIAEAMHRSGNLWKF